MNLFLLTAVPLAAVALHRLLHPSRKPFADPKTWILGSVWAMLSLIAVAFFGPWRNFTGDLFLAFLGLTATDVLLVPGIVVAAWILTRPEGDVWELALWLTLAFTMEGIRDFAATTRTFDLNELFLVPLDRILLVLVLPRLVQKALDVVPVLEKGIWTSLAAALALTGSLFPVLSFAGWGWLVWAALAVGIAAALWEQKKTASQGSGSSIA